MPAWNLGLIEQAFADAAVDPLRWNAAMDIAAAATNSVGAVLLPIHGRIPGVPCSPSIAPMIASYFRDGWFQYDARERGLATMMRRGAFTDFDFTNLDEITRHPYYQEFLGPHGLRWFGGIKLSFGEDMWCLAIQRSIEQGPFSPRELGRLAKLSNRLGSAAAFARAIGFSAASVALETYESSKTAIVLFNRRGEATRVNQQAEKMLGLGIRIIKKRLVSDQPQATDALDRALHALIWGNRGSSLMPPVPMPRTGHLPLLAYPLKLSSIAANVFSDCQAILVLIDPEKRDRPPEAALQAAFGLTVAEARLASRLATGEAIEKVSDALGIAKETARTQLKNIFTKTSTHRQAELVALIASLFF